MTRVLLALALLAAFVLAWQGVASLDSVDDLTLASPVETWEALREDRALLVDNAWVTLVEVLLGLALAVAAGVTFAVAMHLVRPLRMREGRGGDQQARADPERHRRSASARSPSSRSVPVAHTG